MKFRLIALIALAAAMISVQCVSAATVNIKYNGQTRQTAEINAEQVINWDINVDRNASDFTWSRVNVHVSAISGDSARPIGKMYLYRCKAYKPIDCIMKADVPEPLEFGSYADADLAWDDISAAGGLLRYPQVSNLMLLAKLEGENEAWVGTYIKIERTDYNQFNIPFNYELRDVDVTATSENLVEPVKTYINNFHMIPMKWVSNVSFQSSSLYALGASKEDFEAQPVNFRPERPTGQINQITKDFYLVFPETVEGVANPVTLNLNPTSQCGDGTCQSALGESSASCCYDCGCVAGQYCDVPNTTSLNAGICKQGNISVEIGGLFQAPITNCESEGSTHFTARIMNAPAGLVSEEFSGTLQIEDFMLSVECTGAPNALDCAFDSATDIVCGGFERPFTAAFALPIEYYNGQNTIITELRANRTGTVKYQCKCGDGMFCSTQDNSCQEEESMGLTILEFTTPKYNVKTGGTIKMVAQIDGAPPNYTTSAARYNIQEILQGEEDVLPGLAGLMNCTPYADYGEPDVYNCNIAYTISGYDRTLEYVLTKGKISLKIDYNDVGVSKTRTIATDMPDTIIPMSECGDAHCDKEKGETEKTCCMDCGCGKNATGMYCDQMKGCNSIDSVGLSVQGLQPASFDDCAVDHKASLKATIGSGTQQTPGGQSGGSGGLTGQITGMGIAVQPTKQAKAGVPTGLTVDSYELLENGGPSDLASISCNDVNEVTGALNCQVDIAPIDECKTAKTIGPLELQIEASWPNGAEETVTTTLTATVSSITVKPTYQAGDGECEENYGESAANSCKDCPCADDPKFGSGYYCDTGSKGGTCRSLSSVKLVIDSPKETVKVSSCKEDKNIDIIARITNAPGGTAFQSASGTIDGKTAKVTCTMAGSLTGGLQSSGGALNALVVADVTGRYIGVEPEVTEEPCATGNCGIKPTSGSLDGGSGQAKTINCVLTLPADEKCDDTKEYTHTATLSVYISYNNGDSIDSGVLTQQLPEIKVNSADASAETPEGQDDIAYVENMLKKKVAEMEKLKAAYQSCNGQWNDPTKYAGKLLMYKSAQTQTETIVDLLCKGAESSNIPKEIKDAACVLIKGAGAALTPANEAALTQTQTSNIDLTIEGGSMSVTTADTSKGKSIATVKYRLENTGSERGIAFEIRIRTYTQNGESEQLTTLNPEYLGPISIAGSNFSDKTTAVTADSAIRKVEIFIDYDNKVVESDESNNCFSIDIDNKVTACGKDKTSIIMQFLQSDAGKRFSQAAVTELEKRFGYQLSFPVAGVQVDVDLPIGQALAQIISKTLGVNPGGLNNPTEQQNERIGAALTEEQKARCDIINAQLPMITKDAAQEYADLNRFKCVQANEEKKAAGKCEGLASYKCKDELDKCKAELNQLLKGFLAEIQAATSTLTQAEEIYENALQRAAAAGHAVYVPGVGEFYFDSNNDAKPDILFCGPDTNVKVVASCNNNAEAKVVKVTTSGETPFSSTASTSSASTSAATSSGFSASNLIVVPGSIAVCAYKEPTKAYRTIENLGFYIKNTGASPSPEFVIRVDSALELVRSTAIHKAANKELTQTPIGPGETRWINVKVNPDLLAAAPNTDNSWITSVTVKSTISHIDTPLMKLTYDAASGNVGGASKVYNKDVGTGCPDLASAPSDLTLGETAATGASSTPTSTVPQGSTYKASSLFSKAGPQTFRLYCGNTKVGEKDVTACYCDGTQCTETGCSVCREYFQEGASANQQAGTAPATATSADSAAPASTNTNTLYGVEIVKKTVTIKNKDGHDRIDSWQLEIQRSATDIKMVNLKATERRMGASACKDCPETTDYTNYCSNFINNKCTINALDSKYVAAGNYMTSIEIILTSPQRAGQLVETVGTKAQDGQNGWKVNR